MAFHIALLLIAHLVADFFLQPRTMAKRKTIDTQWLLRHGIVQWFVFFFVTLFFFRSFKEAAAFAGINSVIHCAIDWHIWQGYKMLLSFRMFGSFDLSIGKKEYMSRFAFWDDYWFYTFIGIGQCLHALTLIFLYQAFV